MDLVIIYAVIAGIVVVSLLSALLFFLKYNTQQGTHARQHVEGQEDVRRNRPVPVRVGGGRRAVRNRLAPARRDPNESDEDFDDLNDDSDDTGPQFDEKIGAKKRRKLEEKAARRAQREAEEEERRERREREERLERKRKKEEEQKRKEDQEKAAEEQRLKEERAQREHEEYLKMKEAFSVDEEGVDVQNESDAQSLLQEFVDYIEKTKIVMLEDLAAHFNLKTQEAIDRVKSLQAEGLLSGVIDDRGKFIGITASEYEAVAHFIKQRGRVTITELCDSMNRLIHLSADRITTNENLSSKNLIS